MSMTASQLQTFATAIAAETDQTIVDALVFGANNVIREWYNELISPFKWILLASVDVDTIVSAIDWSTDYAAFKDDIPAISFLLQNGTYNPQPVSARNALNEIFAGASNTKAAILGVATRQASRVEALFLQTTTGPGGGDGSTQGQSAIPGFMGPCLLQDVRDAVALIP